MNRKYILKYTVFVIYVFLMFSVLHTPTTNARISDTEEASHHILTAGIWEEKKEQTDYTAPDPSVSLEISADRTLARFIVHHVSSYTTISYTLTYDTDAQPNGIQGQADLSGEETFERQHIILGTCSSQSTCTYHHGISNLKISVTLTDNNGNKLMLESSL